MMVQFDPNAGRLESNIKGINIEQIYEVGVNQK